MAKKPVSAQAQTTTPTDPLDDLLRSDDGSPLPESPAEAAAPTATPTPEPAADPAPFAPDRQRSAPPAASPAAAPRRRGGFLAPFLTGVAAVALGFAGAVYVLPRLPSGWLPTSADTQLPAALAEQTARIDALDAALAALPAPSADTIDTATLDTRLAALRDDIVAGIVPAAAPDLSGLEGRLADLDTRLTALEKRPAAGGAVSSSAIEAIDREISALRAELAAQTQAGSDSGARIAAAAAEAEARIAAATAAAESLRAETDEIARKTSARAAASLVQAALESGAGFESALSQLADAGVAVPQALADQAAGVPTLAALRSEFAVAARAALAATAAVAGGDGFLGRVGAFLRSQTGARSVSPREGDDPDAILSRAEAALAQGDLAAALAGVAALPAEGQAAMSGWTARAQARQAATDALSALSAGLN